MFWMIWSVTDLEIFHGVRGWGNLRLSYIYVTCSLHTHGTYISIFIYVCTHSYIYTHTYNLHHMHVYNVCTERERVIIIMKIVTVIYYLYPWGRGGGACDQVPPPPLNLPPGRLRYRCTTISLHTQNLLCQTLSVQDELNSPAIMRARMGFVVCIYPFLL